ncbi:MAG: MBL fold metallo-hydrolase [Flavobacteriales bacterium]|jgi:metallo-beta-lactamase family protein|nr:MBL fold metallo-hydrolase [Flavobacteriales bacterium]
MSTENKITVHFLGAAGTVTGSKFLIDTGEHKILVDCGLFQGLKELRLKNWDQFPVNVPEIDAVVLTHGHMDHTGYLPRLMKMGFKGPIHGTRPTLEIAEIILLDSAKIQEEEAKKANQEGYSKHHPAEPLYDLKDAEEAIEHFNSLAEGVWIELYPEINIRFQYNGHIIGATFIEMDIKGKRFVFSGDIGRPQDKLLRPPKKPQKADVLFMESTYGDRVHSEENLEDRLKEIINNTYANGGTLIIPSFAVERTQTLMYVIWKLRQAHAIPQMPLIMDSPMAANVLKVFEDNREWHTLKPEEYTGMCNLFRIVTSYKETWEVINDEKPKIVIAGSGMISGGRVLTYLQHYIGKIETTVLLAGFQAAGTRGRKLLEGASELKIYGKEYPVEAEVINLEVLSAHADQPEMLDWMSEIKTAPEHTFIIHGEAEAAATFKEKIKERYGWESTVPELYSIVEIPID